MRGLAPEDRFEKKKQKQVKSTKIGNNKQILPHHPPIPPRSIV